MMSECIDDHMCGKYRTPEVLATRVYKIVLAVPGPMCTSH